MYSHVVHVCRTNLRRWELIGIDERNRDTNIRGQNTTRIILDCNIHELEASLQYSDMETWYFEDKGSAEAAARKFSREKPGRQIMLLELVNVYQAAIGETVKMNYTDKGLVPG